ncbi:unnamed protein product, partial [Didymodactylos carnosus]
MSTTSPIVDKTEMDTTTKAEVSTTTMDESVDEKQLMDAQRILHKTRNFQLTLVDQLHWMENEMNERFSEFRNDLDFQHRLTKSITKKPLKSNRRLIEDRVFLPC